MPCNFSNISELSIHKTSDSIEIQKQEQTKERIFTTKTFNINSTENNPIFFNNTKNLKNEDNYNSINIEFNNNNSSKPTRKLNFNKNFNELKISLKILENSRKFELDSMLKRIKAKFFRAIHKCISKCLVDPTELKRLAQKFITDIKIPANKKILNYTIEQIYSLNNINISYSYLSSNQKIQENYDAIYNELLEMTFIQAYQMYFESNQFERDCQDVKIQESEAFFELFKYTTENFIDYYKFSKGNLMKKKIKNDGKCLFLTIQT